MIFFIQIVILNHIHIYIFIFIFIFLKSVHIVRMGKNMFFLLE